MSSYKYLRVLLYKKQQQHDYQIQIISFVRILLHFCIWKFKEFKLLIIFIIVLCLEPLADCLIQSDSKALHSRKRNDHQFIYFPVVIIKERKNKKIQRADIHTSDSLRIKLIIWGRRAVNEIRPHWWTYYCYPSYTSTALSPPRCGQRCSYRYTGISFPQPRASKSDDGKTRNMMASGSIFILFLNFLLVVSINLTSN